MFDLDEYELFDFWNRSYCSYYILIRNYKSGPYGWRATGDGRGEGLHYPYGFGSKFLSYNEDLTDCNLNNVRPRRI